MVLLLWICSHNPCNGNLWPWNMRIIIGVGTGEGGEGGPKPPQPWLIGGQAESLTDKIFALFRPDYELFNETSWMASYTVSSAWLTARSSVKKCLLACLSSLDGAKMGVVWLWNWRGQKFRALRVSLYYLGPSILHYLPTPMIMGQS